MSNVKKDATEKKPDHIIRQEEFEKSLRRDKREKTMIGWGLLAVFVAFLILVLGWLGFIEWLGFIKYLITHNSSLIVIWRQMTTLQIGDSFLYSRGDL